MERFNAEILSHVTRIVKNNSLGIAHRYLCVLYAALSYRCNLALIERENENGSLVFLREYDYLDATMTNCLTGTQHIYVCMSTYSVSGLRTAMKVFSPHHSW